MEERDEESCPVEKTPSPPRVGATWDNDESRNSCDSEVIEPNIPEESSLSEDGVNVESTQNSPEIDKEYEVESILDKSEVNGITYYKVKWLGYDRPEDDTWEPEGNLGQCGPTIRAFEKRLKSGVGSQQDLEAAAGAATELNEDPGTSGDEGKKKNQANIEAMDVLSMSTMFRRVWRDGEYPVCILGSCVETGYLIHLVRIKTREDEPDPDDALEGLSSENAVMVLADAFARRFPIMTVDYYEKNAAWVTTQDTEEESAAKAARAVLAHDIRISGASANLTQLYADMMTPPVATNVDNNSESKQDSMPQEEVVEERNDERVEVASRIDVPCQPDAAATDRFGLPLDKESSGDSDGSSDEEVINEWKTDRGWSKKTSVSKSVECTAKTKLIENRRSSEYAESGQDASSSSFRVKQYSMEEPDKEGSGQ